MPPTRFYSTGRRARRTPYLTVFEGVDFGSGSGIVHSSRWPVLNRPAWVADTDDFGYPVLCGRHGLNPDFRRRFRQPWPPDFDEQVRRRLRNMLGAYIHPSCKRIFFRSQYALDDARNWLSELEAGPAAEEFLRKACVLYPAQAVLAAEAFARKWDAPVALEIVFCGRDYWTKGGRLALQVFERLLESGANVRCTYIGTIPTDERPRRVCHYPSLERPEVLSVFAKSHVLFHPSPFEGLGTVLLEASAAGLAVVCAKGRGMEHIDEVFDGGGAFFVDRDAPAPEEAFEQHLRALIADPAAAAEMGRRNHERSSAGKFSLVEGTAAS